MKALLALLLFASPLAAQTKPLDTIAVRTTLTKTLAAEHNKAVRFANALAARLDSLAKAPVPVPPTPAPVDTTADPYAGIVSAERFAVTSTAALRASPLYNKVESNLSLVSLDTVVRYNGHPTARSDMPAGGSSLGKMAIPVPNLTNVWLRVALRYSPGFTTTGTATTANSLKLIGWGWAGDDGRGDLEIANTSGYQLHWYVPGSPFISVEAGSVGNEWSDGAWYVVIIHYQQTSATTTLTRAWMGKEGTPLTLRATANGSGTPRPVREFAWPFYQNQTRRAAQSVWTGEWAIVDGSKAANPFGVP